MLGDYWRRLRASATLRNGLILASGTSYAQILSLATAPLLSRLYSPGDFGVLSLFMSLSTILVLLGSGAYQLAIMLPDEDREGAELTAVAILLSFATCSLALIAIAIGYFGLGMNTSLHAWALLIPASGFLGGLSTALAAFATRQGEFALVAKTAASRSTVGTATQLILGAIGFAPGGLLLGAFLGVSAANMRLVPPVRRELAGTRPSLADIKRVMADYRRFPLGTLPSTALFAAYNYGLPVIIAALYSSVTLGFWAMAQRLLILPVSFVGQSLTQSYYRKANELRTDRHAAQRFFLATVTASALVSGVPFLALFILGPWLTGLILGPEWVVTGEYMRIMLPGVWMRFVAGGVSSTAFVYSMQAQQVLSNLALALLMVGGAWWCHTRSLPIEDYLWILTIGGVIIALVTLLRYWVAISQRAGPQAQ